MSKPARILTTHVGSLPRPERVVAQLNKLGARKVQLTVYPEANHDSWTETYKNSELYEWLLKQSR